MKKEKSELEKELVYKPIYLPVRFFKKEAYIRIDDYKEVRNKREKVVEGLEEENKKLKIKVASLEGEIKGLNYTIEKLREELSAYDREYFDEDKKAKNIFMEEDTLQELKDIGEI